MADSNEGVPILMWGLGIEMATGISKLLAPKYDMIHFVNSLEAAKAEISAILSGNLLNPTTQTGSNTQRPEGKRRNPVAIAVGAGIPQEDVDALRESLGEEKVAKLAWIKVTPEDGKKAGGPKPELIAPIIRQRLDEAGL